jgi:hypothetical protein
MFAIDKSRLTNGSDTPGRGSEAWRWAIAALVLFVILGEVLLILTTHTTIISSKQYTSDIWFVFDSMWRASLGQRPNVDFQSSIGPAFYLVYRLTAQLFPFSLEMMMRADLLVGCTTALLTALILRGKAQVETVALLALLAFGVTVSGHEMGAGLYDRSYSFLAPYNRWSWGLMVPAAAGLLLPAREERVLPNVLLGLIGTFLLFLKVSYFAAFAGLAVVGLLLDARQTRRGWLRALALILPPLMAALIYSFGADTVRGYAHDLHSAAAINPIRLNKIVTSFPEAALSLALALLVLVIGQGGLSVRRWRDPVRLVALIGAGGAILMQNHDEADVPLYLVALILAYALGWATRREPVDQDMERAGCSLPSAPAFLLVALICAPALFADLFSPVFQKIGAASGEIYHFAAFDGTPMAGFRLKDLNIGGQRVRTGPDIDPAEGRTLSCAWPACEDVERLDDGLVALRRLAPHAGAVLALNFSNPYPALLRAPAPRYGVSWWDFGRSFNDASAPRPARLFQEVDVVMEPRFNGPHDQVVRIYGPALPRFFTLVGETPAWRIWRRKPGAQPGGSTS